MKIPNYRQLNEHDRVRIEVYLKTGKSQYEIAKLLKVHRSTISREIKNRGGILRGYTADFAQEDYQREKQQMKQPTHLLMLYKNITSKH